MKTGESEVASNLAALREKRGFSAAWLAKTVGVTRQTIYAIEAGSFVPNTAVALRLARALETSVEELFSLPGAAPGPPAEIAAVLPGSDKLSPGQPVQLCRVGKRLIATAPCPIQWSLPAGDAAVEAESGAGGKTKVRIYGEHPDFRNRLLVAGCDPGISVLARHVQSAGVELVVAHRNSSQALDLLRQGTVHIAGTHLRDESSGESNIPEIGRLFTKNAVAVVSFAVWEEGIVTAAGNPKGICGIEDLARKDVRMVNREKGSGSRRLLDSHLKRLKIGGGSITGYETLAAGHLPAAWQVHIGAADCCIATRAAARLWGLGFIPLASERYDLVVRRQHLDLPPVQALFDTLNRSAFRRELEGAGGYDAAAAGRRVL
jgi:putative molybdopterin biosynthesis protein